MTLSKRIILIVLLACMFGIFLSGCDEKDPLLGVWEEPTSGITMQFKEDGDLVISNQKTSITLTYEKPDENSILINASDDGSYPEQKMLFRVEEDRLILTMDGVETVFTLAK